VCVGKAAVGHSVQLLTMGSDPKAMQTLPLLLSPETTHVHVPCGQLGVHTGLQSGGVPPAPGTHSCPGGQGGVHTGVVVVVVVVVCSWQVPPEQLPLQHCVPFLHAFPLRLHPGGSAEASRMPTDASAPPTRAAPINLSALPREMLPLASPIASSSKECSLACGGIGSPFPKEGRD
jgi:hypothetical protein